MVLGKLPVPGRPTIWITVGHGGGRVVRRYWVNFQYWGVLLIWIIVGQGVIVLALGAGGVVWTFFLSSVTSLFFLPFSGRRLDIDWDTVSKGR